MANIGSLSLQITANTQPLREGMNSAKQSMKGFENATKDAAATADVSMTKTSMSAGKALKAFTHLGDKFDLPIVSELESGAGAALLMTKCIKGLMSSIASLKGGLIFAGVGILAAVGAGLMSAFHGKTLAEQAEEEADKIDKLLKKRRELNASREAQIRNETRFGVELTRQAEEAAERHIAAVGGSEAAIGAPGLLGAAAEAARNSGLVGGGIRESIRRQLAEGNQALDDFATNLEDRAAGLNEFERRLASLRRTLGPLGMDVPEEALRARHREGLFGDADRQIKEQARVLSMGADEARLFQLSLEGVGQAQIQLIREGMEHNRVMAGSLNEIERLNRAAEAMHDRLLTPLERVNKQFEEMSEMLLQNADFAEDFERGVAGLVDELERAAHVATPHGPSSAATAGSAAAITAINAAIAAEAPLNESPAERAARLSAELVAQGERQERRQQEQLEIWRILAEQGLVGA